MRPSTLALSAALLVAFAAILITILATIYPAVAASRLRPVDGIRYE